VGLELIELLHSRQARGDDGHNFVTVVMRQFNPREVSGRADKFCVPLARGNTLVNEEK